MDLVLWIGGSLIVGGVFGAVLTAFILGRGRTESGDMRQLRHELDDYRQEVAEHFIETAARVNTLTNSYRALTDSYKAVYQHLEQGAYRLVGEDARQAQLENLSSDSGGSQPEAGDSEEPPAST